MKKNSQQNEIEVLPLKKVTKIALKGVRIRIWRSTLVISCIVLAIAFLTYILASDTMQGNVGKFASKTLIEKLTRAGMYSDEVSQDQKVQTYWMVGLAILISFVGIVNAMLMSVAERFREIGTMKCLGALDGFVLKLFLIESTFVGITGTITGVIMGFLLCYLEGFTIYSGETISLLPAVEFLKITGVCLVTGIIITILGALYPAYQAARMKPVVALRAEV